jgi:DivIVA domain-containing protein
MDNSQSSSAILDTLRTVEFRLGLKGYNVDEVDEYLDKAAQEAEALQEHVRQLNERLRQASDRIGQLEHDKRSAPVEEAPVLAEAPVAAVVPVDNGLSDETLQRTLLLAQKFVDQTKRESEAEAATIVANAENSARAALASAEKAVASLQAESHNQLREEVSRLESTRTQLATDVENMARHLESERNRLRSALAEILNWVDENVQPANSLMGVRPKVSSVGKSTPPPPPPLTSGDGSVASRVADDGAPTLNLQNASGSANSGAARPL